MTKLNGIIISQAYAVIRFLCHYAIPVTIFVYCYGRIFHTIRRQSKVVSGHVDRNQATTTTAGTSRDQNTGQIQQQATGASAGTKLSRTEMNVLKTMIAVIVCFIIFWSIGSVANLCFALGVNIHLNAI